MNNVTVFDEPQLEFASGGQLEHPCDGLTLFGPADSEGIEKPQELSYGVIGTKNGVAAFRDFARAMARSILTGNYLDEAVWPHFPGFEGAFHARLPVEPAWATELDTLELKDAATERDDHKRVFSVTSFYLNRITEVKKPGKPLHFIAVIVPDFVFANCRPVSRFQGGHGQRLSKREQRMRALMLDLFESYDPQQYSWSLDFRCQLKARMMALEVPIQIIRESTLRLPAAERRGGGGRQLTPLSDRAWNLSSALYYKSGGKPWRLNGIRDGVCYVGLSFKDMETANTSLSAAQMFLNDGDGLVIPGEEGNWAVGKKGEYHLNKESASRLLTDVLKAYKSLHRPKLEEIFLHTRSRLSAEEIEGYQEACPKGVKLTAVRVATERLGLRLFRAGLQPVLRGTFWQISDRRGFLWASGFKPRLRTYDGFSVPLPLLIDIQHGDADITRIAKDIFALTKLNYNCCRLGDNQPVTTHFAKNVGEILVSNRKLPDHKPHFKFYI
jgi:hypothetical protein